MGKKDRQMTFIDRKPYYRRTVLKEERLYFVYFVWRTAYYLWKSDLKSLEHTVHALCLIHVYGVFLMVMRHLCAFVKSE